jgi:hypothetical protein
MVAMIESVFEGDIVIIAKTTRRQLGWKRVGRIGGALAAAVVLAYGALVGLFIGAVEWTGCFMSCSDPNPVGGALMLILASAAASSAIVAVVWGVTMRPLSQLIRSVGLVAMALAFVAVMLIVSASA